MTRSPAVRRRLAVMVLDLGLALAAIALSAWLVRHTALEPGRTAAAVQAIAESPALRSEIAAQVSTRASSATGQSPFELQPGVEAVLGQADTAAQLAGTLAAAHARLVDAAAPPVAIDTATMSALTQGTVAEEYQLDIPTIGPLAWLRQFIDRWLATVALVAGLLASAGVALHPNPPRALCRLGYGLAAATVVQVVIGYLVPVVVVPTLLDSPWADLVGGVVAAYERRLIFTWASVLAGGGVSLVLASAWGLRTRRGYHD